MKEDRFIRLASKVAEFSQHPRYRLGAVIVKGSSILSIGVNKLKTHTLQNNSYTGQKAKSIHAELSAIIGLSKKQLNGSTIYIARILANGDYGLSKPCASCRILLVEVFVKKAVWTTPIGWDCEKL